MTTDAERIQEEAGPEPVTPTSRARGPLGMQDMTTGPVTRHLLKTTSFMLVIMVFRMR